MRALVPPLLVLIAASSAAHGQEIIEQDRLESVIAEDGSILVIAGQYKGQVDTELPPIMMLDEGDVAAYGASSIGELIQAVSPQTSSGRGRGGGHPVILLNGQRISSFRILRNIPPEAIRRMEVLPEEVAMRFGFPPNQRLINFILKDNYASKTVAGEYNAPTRGGFGNWELEGGLLTIDGPRRFNIEAKIVEDTLLTEAERNVRQAARDIPAVATDPDPARFRSLIDASTTTTLNSSWSTGLGDEGMSGTLGIDGGYTRNETRSLFGLNTVELMSNGETALRSFGDPLERRSTSDTFEGGLALNKPLGAWQLSATADGSYSDTLTTVDRKANTAVLVDAALAGTLDISGPLPSLASPGLDRARTRDLALSTLVTLSGQLLRLPAGEAALTLNTGFDFDRTQSRDTRTATGPVQFKRGDLSAGANIVLPLTSRKDNVLGGIGDISLNFSGGLNHLSDFGTLYDWSGGLTWSPTGKLTLQASYIVNEAAPTLNQLGNPEIISPNVPVFDFTRGEAALVTIIDGGNPNLLAEKQRDIKISANWQVPLFRRSSLLVEYFRNSSDDVTRSFPLLTPASEAAFPGRAVRDGMGRLVSIDQRPVTFDMVESSRLRWGLNLSGRLTKQKEAPPGARRGGGRGRGMPGFGRRGHGGRWNLSVYHTVRFTDRVTIAAVGPVLDQLGGDALSDGGVPRHSLEFEGGVFHKGIGIRLNGNWDSPATVRSQAGPGSSDLRFGSVFRLDARIFINLGMREKLVEKMPFLKGLRLAFDFDNIFDSRQKVTDGTGAVPLAFQADYRDPRGRMVGIDLRKMF